MSATTRGQHRQQRPAVFPGWWVVAGVFIMLLTTAGLGFYGLAVYLRALITEQGFSVGSVSGATALFFLISGVAGLPVAARMQTRDPRPMIAAGAVACGVSLVLLGRVTEVWQLFAVYALFGTGFAAAGLVPGTTLVTRWFSRRRSVALSVASTGLSAGGVLVTPLLASLIDEHGLAAVAPWAGLTLMLGVLAVTALMRPSPEAFGLRPDGDPAPPQDAPPAPLGEMAVDAVRTRFFRAVTLAHLLAMMAQVGGIAHLFNLVSERFDEGLAATALQLMAFSSLAGRLAGGYVAARTSQRSMALVLMVGQGAGLVLVATVPGRLSVLLATVLFGITVGNLLMLHPLLLAERFGVRDYGRIYSRSQLFATLGVAAGPAALGVLFDVLDGYGAAFGLAALASVLAAVVLSTSGPTHPEAAARRTPDQRAARRPAARSRSSAG
ncbi:MAG: major facilitator superfamily 1 [Frankiales bacterium]|nr:major facilitator superfamily 1 [Frankiales bacterium]